MIIQKMNNVLVKHGKVTFAIFTGVVIVSFVWFFTPGVDGSLLFNGSAGSGTKYGAVLGHDVTIGDASDASQIVRMFRAATYGLSPQRVQSPDEDELFQYALLLKAADVLNVQASDQEVRTVIQTLPTFRDENGKFSNELYTKYKDLYLAPSGLGFSDLEEAVRSIIRLQKVPLITTSNVIVPDAEAEAGIESMLQKITYHLITFDPDSFKDQVKVEDAEVQDFYTANPKLFMSEPESDGLLVFAPYTEKKVEVPEDQLKDYYELRKALFVKEDGTELSFDEVKDDIRKELEMTVDRDDAIAKIQAFNKSFRAAIRADKDAFQEDPEKLFREEAGKAGLTISEVKNITSKTQENLELHIEHELIDAVTILHNVGSYTNPLNGEEGSFIFLMTARRPSVIQPFEDVKDVARERVVTQKERALADEAAAQLGLKFMELKDPAAGIEELVKSLNGTWHAEVSRARFEIEGNPYMPAVNEILTTDAGKLSAPDKQYGFPVFVFVSAHTPATAEEIAEQKDVLTGELKYRKQEIVSRGLQNWILGSARTYRPGRNQE